MTDVRPRSRSLRLAAMETAPKRPRAGGGSAPDRLSALPDELIHRILFFLPSRQAVHTAVLSKRWIDLWRSMPAVVLDIREFISITQWSSQYFKDVWGKMENFSTNLLMRHRAPRLDAFRLRIAGVIDDCSRDVDRWIRRATEYCPMKLEIEMNSLDWSVPYQVPKLASCHLKRLVLSGVYLEHSFAEHLPLWVPSPGGSGSLGMSN